MRNKLIISAAVALTFTFLPAVLAAQESGQAKPAAQSPEESIAALEEKAAKAQQDEQWVTWYSSSMKLHQRRPYTPDYMINMVRSAAMLDQKRTAYNYMLTLQRQGLSYDFNQWDETENIRGTEAFDYINRLMVEAGQPSGDGTNVFEMELAPANLGDITWDESRERFLVGTRVKGQVLAVADDGTYQTLIEADGKNGLWSIDGLAVDLKGNTLWVASSASPAFEKFSPADANKGALFSFELDTLKYKARYGLPNDNLPHSLGSIAVTDNSDVYVIDRAVPIVYRKPAEGSTLERFGGSPNMVALTDIAVTPDNSRIFVTDAVMGILLIDPMARRMAMLQGNENLNLYGIYGIEYVNQELILTQSGLSPQRLLRLRLDSAGAAVEAISPMATALEGFETPGAGTIRGNSIYYFANHGTVSPSDDLRLMATPLDSGNKVQAPDMSVFEQIVRENQQKKQQQKEQK